MSMVNLTKGLFVFQNCQWMENGSDPDQTASLRAIWSRFEP